MDIGSVERLMRQAADQSNPALSVPATQQLAPLSKQPGYTQLLISIFSQNVNTPFGFWLSIALKSHIYQYWEPSAGEADVLNDQDRAAVKQTLVQMLLLCPPNQKAQVVHAIGIVSVSDYPAKWPTLVQDLISKISPTDIKLNAILFETLHTITSRFRAIEETEGVSSDLNQLHTYLEPILSIFLQSVNSAEQQLSVINQGHSCLRTPLSGVIHNVDITQLNYQLQSIIFILEIILDLHTTDFSDFLTDESHLKVFFQAVFSLLSVPAFNIKSDLADYTGSSIDAIHRLAIKTIHLVASKYEEDFKPLINDAVFVVWTTLQARDNSPRHDGLMCACLKFFSDLASKPWYQNFFDEEKLVGLIDNVVIRHVSARQDDIDAVTEDESYLERELISTANDEISKRGAVMSLIKSLGNFYQAKVEALALAHVNRFTASYQASPTANWADAESAMILIISMGLRAELFPNHVYPAEITAYIGSTVVPMLNTYTSQPPPSPLLVITAMKALATYRSIIPPDSALPMLKVLLHYIASDEHIIASYSAFCLSMFIGHAGIIKKEVTQTVAGDLLNALMQSLNTHHENQYILAAIVTTIGTSPQHVLPIAPQITQQIFTLLDQAMKAKTNQRYIYLLFEFLACVMRVVIGHSTPETKKLTLGQLENLLFPSFQRILGDNDTMADLHPFVLSIMAMFLEEHSYEIPAVYVPVWGMLLKADFWKTHANISALVRFINAFLHNNVSTPCPELGLDSNQSQQALMGIYQRLMLVAKTHYAAFKLSQGLAAYTTLFVAGSNLELVLRMHFKQLSQYRDSAQLRYQLTWLYSFWVATDSLREEHIANHLARSKTMWLKPSGFLPSADEWTVTALSADIPNSSIMRLFNTMSAIQQGVVNSVLDKVWPVGMGVVDSFQDKQLFFRAGLILARAVSTQIRTTPGSIQADVTKTYRHILNFGRSLESSIAVLKTSGLGTPETHPPSHYISSQAAWAIEMRAFQKTPDVVLRCSTPQLPFDVIDIATWVRLLPSVSPELAACPAAA